MRRINIKYNNKLETNSFDNVRDFENYIETTFNFDSPDECANFVWDLNVGKCLEMNSSYFGIVRFSIQSKARVGNQLVL